MKGLIIVGSARVGSHTNALAKYLIGQLDEHDVDVDIFDLAEKPIHQLDFSGTTQAAEDIKNNVKELQDKAMEADFFILGTPNYHGSFSGILKNALDHLNMDYFKMKRFDLRIILHVIGIHYPLSIMCHRLILRNLNHV